MITEEFIIEYLRGFYETNKTIPLSRDPRHPFSYKTVSNKFGSWKEALNCANVPSFKNDAQIVSCKQCKKEFSKLANQIRKSKNDFCSRSCSGTYTNTHRTTGNRISKLELYLQEHLSGHKYLYNERKTCGGLELDIYVPSKRLAFEINGIFHYKPIFGQDKLNRILEKDSLKISLCKDKNIHLCVIKDESHHFSIEYGERILGNIYKVIHNIDYVKVVEEIMNQ